MHQFSIEGLGGRETTRERWGFGVFVGKILESRVSFVAGGVGDLERWSGGGGGQGFGGGGGGVGDGGRGGL